MHSSDILEIETSEDFEEPQPQPQPKKTIKDRIITPKSKGGSERVHWLSRHEDGYYEIHIYKCDRDAIDPRWLKISGKKHDWLRIDDNLEIIGHNTKMRARGLYLFMKSKHLERATQGGYSGIFSLIGGFTKEQIIVGAVVFVIGVIGLIVMWPLMT